MHESIQSMKHHHQQNYILGYVTSRSGISSPDELLLAVCGPNEILGKCKEPFVVSTSFSIVYIMFRSDDFCH